MSVLLAPQNTTIENADAGDDRTAGRPAAVRIRGLSKHFGSGEQRVQALREVNWDVYPGQMTLIVGPSGCGKTTLLSVIAGILNGDSGSGEYLRQRADRA